MQPRFQNSTAASRERKRAILQAQLNPIARRQPSNATQNPTSLANPLARISKPSMRSAPLRHTRTSKSILIFILLKRHIFPRLPPLPVELVTRILEEAGLYRPTSVSSWKWPEQLDKSLRALRPGLESDWPFCISQRHAIRGPGPHPLMSIVIRWQWNKRRHSDLEPRVYLWLLSPDNERDALKEEINIVETPPVQYNKIQRTSGSIIVDQDSSIVANAQAGDRVLIALCTCADLRELTTQYFCAW